MGNVARPGGEDGRKFDASLHQMIDICPTPKVGAMALELVKVDDKHLPIKGDRAGELGSRLVGC